MFSRTNTQRIDPQILFQKVHLGPKMHVADFGCGRTGHIVFPAAQIVGDKGVVYAVDILKENLVSVEKRARLESLSMIHPVWADVERVGSTKIPERSLDAVCMVNLLSQIRLRTNVLYEAKRLLKPKARIVIVDWKQSALPIAPKKQDLVDMKDILSWAREHNFAVQEEFDMGKWYHGVVLYRHD